MSRAEGIAIGDIWRKDGPCDWIKVVGITLPGFNEWDNGAPGVSVVMSGYKRKGGWQWLAQGWFVLANSPDDFARRMIESGRYAAPHGEPIVGIDPPYTGEEWPVQPMEVQL